MTELERDILNAIAQTSEPVGATTLEMLLREKHNVSQAWIGKKLKELDYRGLTQRCGFKGRVLTAKARDELKKANHYAIQVQENEALLRTLSVSSAEKLRDVLVARRAIEKESAYLAASLRSAEQLRALAEILKRQDHELRKGRIGAGEDMEFHDLIVTMSGNEVLAQALQVIRHASQFTPLLAHIRKRVRNYLVKEHHLIYKQIEKGDPSGASAAMQSHITRLIEDVETYMLGQACAHGGESTKADDSGVK